MSCSNRLHPSTPLLEAPLACFHLKAAHSHLAPDTMTPSRAMVLDSSRTQCMCEDLENVPGVSENISSSETSQRKQGHAHDNFLHSSNQKTNMETVQGGIFFFFVSTVWIGRKQWISSFPFWKAVVFKLSNYWSNSRQDKEKLWLMMFACDNLRSCGLKDTWAFVSWAHTSLKAEDEMVLGHPSARCYV